MYGPTCRGGKTTNRVYIYDVFWPPLESSRRRSRALGEVSERFIEEWTDSDSGQLAGSRGFCSKFQYIRREFLDLGFRKPRAEARHGIHPVANDRRDRTQLSAALGTNQQIEWFGRRFEQFGRALIGDSARAMTAGAQLGIQGRVVTHYSTWLRTGGVR